MDNLIKPILKKYKVKLKDLKPQSGKFIIDTNILKARILITAILKHKKYNNKLILPLLHTNDNSIMYVYLNKVKEDKELFREFNLLKRKFKDIPEQKKIINSLRKCVKCKEKKPTQDNFERNANGFFKHYCNSCYEVLNAKPKLYKEPKQLIKCRRCESSKLRDDFNLNEKGSLKRICKTCEESKVTTYSKSKEKDNTVGLVVNSYEEKQVLKITAEEAKKANDLREKEMFNKGARYVKSTKHIRAYVISR